MAQPKDQAIKCGRGVELSTDGNSAIAAVAGLPHLKGNTLEVLPVLELNSDADISTGNISFDGAIVIRGSVLENVKVESHSGTVHVGGLVSGATIRSRGSIVVYKNVVSSDLQAGGLSIVQMKLAVCCTTSVITLRSWKERTTPFPGTAKMYPKHSSSTTCWS